MGLFTKKKKKDEVNESSPMKESEGLAPEKKKTDKSIKERAPKSRTGLKLLRTCIWVFMCFIIFKGCMSFVQGTRVINQTVINGNTAPIIEEKVKGFAADFAAEYFTWNIGNFSERSTRLSGFISGIDSDAGIKALDIRGSSRVLSTEVFDTKKISDNQVEVTVMVRREVEPLMDQTTSQPPQSKDNSTQEDALIPLPDSEKSIKKVYMVVPVTLVEEGMVIRSYPRFVSEILKAESIEAASNGPSISDTNTIALAKELTGSFLNAWYEGNISQLRYFYSNADDAPKSLNKSAFDFDRVESLNMYRNETQSGVMKILATVIVKSDIGESFTNAWSFEVIEKDGRLYMLDTAQEEDIIETENQELTSDPLQTTKEETPVDPASNNQE